MMNGQPRTFDGNTVISIPLSLLQWQQIMNVLQDAPAPWKLTNPLIVELGKQIEMALQGVPSVDQQPSPPA